MKSKYGKVSKMGFACLDLNDNELVMLIQLIEKKRRKERTHEIFLPYEKLGWIEEKNSERQDDVYKAAQKLQRITFEVKATRANTTQRVFTRLAVWWDNGITIGLSDVYDDFLQDGYTLLGNREIIAEKYFEFLKEREEMFQNVKLSDLVFDKEGYEKRKGEGW